MVESNLVAILINAFMNDNGEKKEKLTELALLYGRAK